MSEKSSLHFHQPNRSVVQISTPWEDRLGGWVALVFGTIIFALMGAGVGEAQSGAIGVWASAAFALLLMVIGLAVLGSRQHLILFLHERRYVFKSNGLLRSVRKEGTFEDFKEVAVERQETMGSDERTIRWAVVLRWQDKNLKFVVASTPKLFHKSVRAADVEAREIAQGLRQLLGLTHDDRIPDPTQAER